MAEILECCAFPPHRLQLEVTETYVLENPDRARAAISHLKALGSGMALDDFGTGYSSIGYLRHFNFDAVKIDKSLAGLVDTDEQAAALVGGTIRIASALGMKTVAERGGEREADETAAAGGCGSASGIFLQPADAD